MVHDLVVRKRTRQVSRHDQAVLQGLGLATRQVALDRWYPDLAVAVTDAALTGDGPDRLVGPDPARSHQALVVRLAQPAGVAATVAAVDRARLRLGPARQWTFGLHVAGSDEPQVVAVAPSPCVDGVFA
jgi:hypothetical protein